MKKITNFISRNWLLLVVVLSLVLKIAFLLHGDIINRDGALYIVAAQCHLKGDFAAGLAYYRMPLYPMVLAAVYTITGNWIIAGKLMSILPLVACIWPLYVITRRLFDDNSARWTVLLFAVLPVFNFAVTSIMRDPLALLFVLTSIATFLVFYQDGYYRYLIVSSVCVLLALMTRVEGVLLVGVIVLGLVVYIFKYTDKFSFSWRFIMVLIPIAIFVVMASIYGNGSYARLEEVSRWGRELMTMHIFNGYQRLMELLYKMQLQSPAANYHCNLLEVTRHYAPLIYIIGIAELLGKIIFPTSLLAFFSRRILRVKYVEKPHQRGRWIVKLVWLVFFTMNFVFVINRNFTTKRYLWIPAVLLLPWIGNGIAHWWENRSHRSLLCYCLVAVVILTPMAKTVIALTKDDDLTIITASEWLHDYAQCHKLNIVYNDIRFYAYIQSGDELRDGMRVYNSMATLKKVVNANHTIDMVGIYYSNKHPLDYELVGYGVVKHFTGSKKTVIFMQKHSPDYR